MTLLQTINSPVDLRRLQIDQLQDVADEVRQYILETMARVGGHTGASLGAVELAVALHYAFDTPHDRLVWDVGHQTYVHKILTGRRAGMPRLRMYGGIAGFPRREESEYDTFGTAHSSTSISAALGMAVAARQLGDDRRVVAIIGDGAMTAGMAFEALNNAGAMDANLLVILNDNDMSISENVGALNNYLARLMSGRFYAAARPRSPTVRCAPGCATSPGCPARAPSQYPGSSDTAAGRCSPTTGRWPTSTAGAPNRNLAAARRAARSASRTRT